MENEFLIPLIPDERIIGKIFLIRGIKVMLDFDLAELYNVETKQLKRAVRRNLSRFPADFMFELNPEELNNLRCQFGTSSWGGSRYPPMAFTEYGVLMLSSVLNNEKAVQVNIQIIRVFSKMRDLLFIQGEILEKIKQLENKEIEQDEKIILILGFLKQMEERNVREDNFRQRVRIGFKG
jgi:hypothetical protein